MPSIQVSSAHGIDFGVRHHGGHHPIFATKLNCMMQFGGDEEVSTIGKRCGDVWCVVPFFIGRDSCCG